VKPLIALVGEEVSLPASVLRSALLAEGFDVAPVPLAHAAQQLPGVVAAGINALVIHAAQGDHRLPALLDTKQRVEQLQHIPAVLVALPSQGAKTESGLAERLTDVIEQPTAANDVGVLLRFELAPLVNGTPQLTVEELYPARLLRALLSGRRSGKMELLSIGVSIHFRERRVVEVRGASQFGIPALARALATAHGPYSVSFGDVSSTNTPVCDLQELNHTVMPRLERFEKIALTAPALLTFYVAQFKGTVARLNALPKEVKRVFQLFDGSRTLGQALWDSHLEETTALMVALKLMRLSLLKREVEAAPMLPYPPGHYSSPSPTPFREGQTGNLKSTQWADTTPVLVDAGQGLKPVATNDDRTESSRVSASNQWTDTTPALPQIGERAKQLADAAASPIPHSLSPPPLPKSSDPNAPSPELQAPEAPLPRISVEAAQQAVSTDSAFPSFGAATPNAPRSQTLLLIGLVISLLGVMGFWLWPSTSEMPSHTNELKEIEIPSMRSVAADAGPEESALEIPPTEGKEAKAETTEPTRADVVRLAEQGDSQQALQLLENMAQRAPLQAADWLLTAQLKYDLRDAAGARAAVERVLAIDANNSEVHMLLASLAKDQGDLQAYQEELQTYLSLEPKGKHAVEAKALLSRIEVKPSSPDAE
jgi:Tetratricopeptide repeat